MFKMEQEKDLGIQVLIYCKSYSIAKQITACAFFTPGTCVLTLLDGYLWALNIICKYIKTNNRIKAHKDPMPIIMFYPDSFSGCIYHLT